MEPQIQAKNADDARSPSPHHRKGLERQKTELKSRWTRHRAGLERTDQISVLGWSVSYGLLFIWWIVWVGCLLATLLASLHGRNDSCKTACLPSCVLACLADWGGTPKRISAPNATGILRKMLYQESLPISCSMCSILFAAFLLCIVPGCFMQFSCLGVWWLDRNNM